MFKNWKSILSWAMFMAGYAYALSTGKPEGIVYTTGIFAVMMSVSMMFRSEMNTELISKLIDKVGK